MGKTQKRWLLQRILSSFFSKFNLGTTNFKLLLDVISNVLKKKKNLQPPPYNRYFQFSRLLLCKIGTKIEFLFFLSITNQPYRMIVHVLTSKTLPFRKMAFLSASNSIGVFTLFLKSTNRRSRLKCHERKQILKDCAGSFSFSRESFIFQTM